jgi:hypothetical protein
VQNVPNIQTSSVIKPFWLRFRSSLQDTVQLPPKIPSSTQPVDKSHFLYLISGAVVTLQKRLSKEWFRLSGRSKAKPVKSLLVVVSWSLAAQKKVSVNKLLKISGF